MDVNNYGNINALSQVLGVLIDNDPQVSRIDEETKQQLKQKLTIACGLDAPLEDDSLIFYLIALCHCYIGESPKKSQKYVRKLIQYAYEMSLLRDELKRTKAVLENFNGREVQIEQVKAGANPAKKKEISAARVYALKQEGKSVQKIAKLLGVSRGLVYRRLEEAEKDPLIKQYNPGQYVYGDQFLE